MSQPNKKTAPRTTNTSAKRSKNEPDVPNYEVRWNDLNYNLITDIFSHFFTTQRLKYRRVSSAWNSMLLHHLSTSTDVSLQFSDLKHWKSIIYPPAREVPLVTERTRRLIIDFASVDFMNRRNICGPNNNEFQFPLAAVGRYHPQICNVVLCRVTEFYIRHHSDQYLIILVCMSNSMSNISPNVRMSLCDFAYYYQQSCDMFSTAEQTLIKSWKMAWPNVTFMCEKESFDNMIRERSMAYWPYPSNQLTWMSNCLDMLPAEDLLLRFLAVAVSVAGVDDFKNFNPPPTFITLRGKTYAGFTLAVIARYLTTFRPHFNLPPPPYPLIWSDSF